MPIAILICQCKKFRVCCEKDCYCGSTLHNICFCTFSSGLVCFLLHAVLNFFHMIFMFRFKFLDLINLFMFFHLSDLF